MNIIPKSLALLGLPAVSQYIYNMYNIYTNTYIYVDYAIEAIIIRGSSKQNIERHNLIPEENNKKVNRQLTLLDV